MNELVKDVADFFPYTEGETASGPIHQNNIQCSGKKVAHTIEGSNGFGKIIAALSACLPKAFEKNLKILYVDVHAANATELSKN